MCISMHMYLPSVICGQNMVSVGCMVMEDLSMKTCIHLTKSLNHENEGNANWQLSGCINVLWSMYGLSMVSSGNGVNEHNVGRKTHKIYFNEI